MINLQTELATWMDQLAGMLPFGYAFGAGMVATVNPCGFAMLPAYLSLYLGKEEGGEVEMQAMVRRMSRAVGVTLAVSAGFTLLFGAVGSLVSVGGMLLMQVTPWAALFIGVLLVALGFWLLTGRYLSAGFLSRLSNRIGDPRQVSFRGFFLFGVAFGVTSLSCTLPIFLAVMGSAVVAGSFLAGTAQFLGYSLGMTTVLLALTLALALFKEGLVLRLRSMMPYVQRVSALLLIGAGSYIVYYWLSSGILLS